MSTVPKSDKLKTKKAETHALMSDAAPIDRKLPSKKQIASRTQFKNSSRLSESKSVSNEINPTGKSKLPNAASTTTNIAKIGAQRRIDRSIITGSSQANKSSPRAVSTSSQGKHVSLRAKQLSKTTTIIKTTGTQKTSNSLTDTKSVIQKKNSVLDTSHNVTVSSPPSKRKHGPNSIASNSDKKVDTSKLIRKGSRTLAPDEIVVLKEESAKIKSEEAIRNETLQVHRELATGKRESIAFEVKFEENEKKERQNCSGKIVALDEKQRSDEETIYSDDFESYESDFETGSSGKSLFASGTPSDDENRKVSEEAVNQEDSLSQTTSDDSELEDATEITQRPVLEIQIDKEERKLDSGHYDTSLRKANAMKSLDPASQSSQPCNDNWEATTSLGISEQMDSGISTCVTFTPVSDDKNDSEVIYGGYRYFYDRPIISSRGWELKSKIQFDVLSFTLIELKPISYEIFMQTFGKINSNQNFTQTHDNQRNVEQQTEVQGTRTFWTQHPAQFVLAARKNFNNNSGMYNLFFCGEGTESNELQLSYCELDRNLHAMKRLKSQNSKREYRNYHNQEKNPINYQLLHSFLLRSSFLIDQVLGSSKTNPKSSPISHPAHGNDQVLKQVCERSFYTDINFLNTLRVIKIFSNHKFNLLITVHESLPDSNVYSSDFANLLMVWCTNTCDKPIRLLTTWSEVSKVEIPNDSSDYVVAALRDGSIALWDLRETHSFCSKLDGYLTHFAATQSIVPSYTVEGDTNKLIVDIGACLDVKHFKSTADNNILLQPTFPKAQFASLHEAGIVTVWTLVQTSEITFTLVQAEPPSEQLKCSTKFTQIFDSISPWARVKLMQSSIVNVRNYLETKSSHSQSRFDKTKDLFQKNIYSDQSLRELSETTPEVGCQGIRFTSLECGTENVFICTNRNFILMCSKALKMDKLKRICIDDSQFLFPTALKLLHNERFLAVGLCNGVVMILNCHSDKVRKSHKESEVSKRFDDKRDRILNSSLTTSKSCAIQNILLNVQKSCEKMDSSRDYRPSTAAYMTLIDSKRKPFELNVIDQQIIMSGSALRKNLIQHLEQSSDGWYLFALKNGHIKVYDFYLEQEILSEESPQPGNIIDFTTGTCGCKENSLMILRPNTPLEVIILKQ